MKRTKKDIYTLTQIKRSNGLPLAGYWARSPRSLRFSARSVRPLRQMEQEPTDCRRRIEPYNLWLSVHLVPKRHVQNDGTRYFAFRSVCCDAAKSCLAIWKMAFCLSKNVLTNPLFLVH